MLVLALAPACNDKGKSKAAPVAVDESAEQALVARRDALLKSRQGLADEKAKLAAEREKIASEGGDTSEVDKRVEELRSKEATLSTQESIAASGDVPTRASPYIRSPAAAGPVGPG